MTLYNTIFTDYDLNNSSFLEVNFKGCDFSKVYLSGASLCGSFFEDCIFKDNIYIKGNSDYAIFKKSNIAGTNAFRTSFYECDFSEMTIIDSEMRNCSFINASFSNVIFKNVNFDISSFHSSIFHNVKFIDCSFEKLRIDEAVGIESVDFKNTTIILNGETKIYLGNEIKNYFSKLG
ncbi:pentapeptide repeat-containing protein [Lysinibacillus xylanilyticus]|uniref:Pentapeptide repeat-containing protein n=1 Tax=Lysinibacillus xylanilyticus TaxID=582475 RepID=A0ABV3VY18_9BACI